MGALVSGETRPRAGAVGGAFGSRFTSRSESKWVMGRGSLYGLRSLSKKFLSLLRGSALRIVFSGVVIAGTVVLWRRSGEAGPWGEGSVAVVAVSGSCLGGAGLGHGRTWGRSVSKMWSNGLGGVVVTSGAGSHRLSLSFSQVVNRPSGLGRVFGVDGCPGHRCRRGRAGHQRAHIFWIWRSFWPGDKFLIIAANLSLPNVGFSWIEIIVLMHFS